MEDKYATVSLDPKSISVIPTPVTSRRLRKSPRRLLAMSAAAVIVVLFVASHCCRGTQLHHHLGAFGIAQSTISRPVHGYGHPLRGKAAEELLLSIPSEANAILSSRKYAGQPHMAGTPGDLFTAKSFLSLLQTEFGVDTSSGAEPIYAAGSPESQNATRGISKRNTPSAWIDTYYPVLNAPLDRSLEIVGEDGETIWKAELEEVASDVDPYASKYAEAVPTWHGISKGGVAEGKLVYAHYGRKQDYDALEEAGVDFSGKIVIARYGGNFRGLKVKRAQELGAAAVLIYSDLRDDGTVTVENGYIPYPLGPARNPTSVQRGSVQFLSLYPGDPSTPGYPSYENATRGESPSKPTIPSLPISWANAEVLLEEAKLGDEGRTIRLVNNVDEKVTPIWNTMGVIPGHIKDEVVILGGHRDAWVLGATDPSSGTVSTVEVVRALGALIKKGWQPLRTIVIASWDAEEYGLIGSTEYGEDFEDWINEHVVAYINIDSSTSGSKLRSSASPLLAHLLRDTAEQIPHPTALNRTLWDARLDNGELYGGQVDAEVVDMHEADLLAQDSIGVTPLGSGSDYTLFLQHIGIPSTDGGFKSTLHDPVYHYHSVFDSETWQELYGDPGFHRHIAVAKHLGLQLLRLSGDWILPFNTTHYSYELEVQVERVEAIASNLAPELDFSSLEESVRKMQAASIALDVERTEAEHQLQTAIIHYYHRHYISDRVRKAICKIKKALGKECDATSGRSSRKLVEAIERIQEVNHKLIAFERGFISKDGLKDREWYKHLGVAPGRWLGYGATTLPGLTEALTLDNDIEAAAYEIRRLAEALHSIAGMLQI
ncbi:Zn-dependent exopeptidase [Coniophora puteana RWD-64-598 SS2]|uniref:Zn-dependent exopeptidase n=1 Tax=Coniophora puteana (strain RWD-64-598) TaxID=741705 RepID=A0A5M3MU29_CONPW|nr:Zn-dependent exopeptidase [Coniophora puteana RWD-64-598 SS2]EIW82081.1 Zn-dependent exopeptidase [Coniophora puteana RWD-64-598 SS2]